MIRSALISDCGRFREVLMRTWDDRPKLLVLMFNPSDADHEVDDPTIKLTCAIASHNGFGGIVVVNLCPLRSSVTGPAFAMLASRADSDIRVLCDNLERLERELEAAGAVLLAWGRMGDRAGQWLRMTLEAVKRCEDDVPVHVLGWCKNGQPIHPLARGKHKLRKDAPLLPWRAN